MKNSLNLSFRQGKVHDTSSSKSNLRYSDSILKQAIEKLSNSASLSHYESSKIIDLLDSSTINDKDKATVIKVALTRPEKFPPDYSENKLLYRCIKRLEKLLKEPTSVNEQLELVKHLADSMGNLQAASLKKSTVRTFKGGLRPSQDPQLKAYKVVKHFLQKQTDSPETARAFISHLWSGDTINDLSQSTRTLSSGHWKRIITSLAANAALTAIGQGVTELAIELVGLPLESLMEMKDAFEAKYPLKDLGNIDKAQPTAEELAEYHEVQSEIEHKSLQQDRVQKSGVAIGVGVQAIAGAVGLGKEGFQKAVKEFKTWGPIGTVRTALALARLPKTRPLASIQEAATRLTPIILESQLKQTQKEKMEATAHEVAEVWTGILTNAFSDKSTLSEKNKVDLLINMIKQFNPENREGLSERTAEKIIVGLLGSVEKQHKLKELAIKVHKKDKSIGTILTKHLLNTNSLSYQSKKLGDTFFSGRLPAHEFKHIQVLFDESEKLDTRTQSKK